MSVVSPIPPSITSPVMVACLAQLPRTHAFLSRGGGAYGTSPSSRTPLVDPDQPPIGVVLGAGAVGALAGHVVFHSLLVSVGLGLGAMGLAASSDDKAGDIARSSGKIALAAFEMTSEVNHRYHLTDRVAQGARRAGDRLKELDREHAVVHRTTEGAKQAWRGVKQYDERHKLTARAGEALSSGLDKVAEALTPPASPSDHPSPTRNSSRNRSSSGNTKASTSPYGSVGSGSSGRGGGGDGKEDGLWGEGFVGGGGRGGAGGGVGDEDGMWGDGFGGGGSQGGAGAGGDGVGGRGGGGGGGRGGGRAGGRDAGVKDDAEVRQHPHSFHREDEELSGGLPSPSRGVEKEEDAEVLWDDEDTGWSR